MISGTLIRGRMAMAMAALGVAFMPASLHAHSGVTATTPANGATVAALPGSIRITFGEAIGRVIFVTATDAAGKNHVVSAKMDPAKASRVLTRTRDSRPGRYRVQWKVVATDGHAQAGTYTFTVKPGKS